MDEPQRRGVWGGVLQPVCALGALGLGFGVYRFAVRSGPGYEGDEHLGLVFCLRDIFRPAKWSRFLGFSYYE